MKNVINNIQVKFYDSQTLEELPMSLIKENEAILNEFKELVKSIKNRKN